MSVIEGLLTRQISKRQILRQRRAIELWINPAMRQHRFDLRSEQQPLRRQFVVQRLDAQAVARDEERFRVAIPDGKGEHAAQVLHTIRAVLFEEVNDGFGIAVRAVAVAARDELFAQGEMVVNLAVEDDPESAIFIRNRLMSAGNVDNA